MKKYLKLMLGLVLIASLCLTNAFAMVNPWVETDEQGAMEKVGAAPLLPEDAEDPHWSVMEDGQNSIAQLTFTLDGFEYTARAKSSSITDDIEDISGMCYDWESVEEDMVNGTLPCKLMQAHDGDMTVETVIWLDVVPGFVYSLSTVQPDVDGLDMVAIAGMVTPVLQGEA